MQPVRISRSHFLATCVWIGTILLVLSILNWVAMMFSRFGPDAQMSAVQDSGLTHWVLVGGIGVALLVTALFARESEYRLGA